MADCKKHDKLTLSASEVMAEGAVLFRDGQRALHSCPDKRCRELINSLALQI